MTKKEPVNLFTRDISRRQFVKQALAAGVSVTALGSLLKNPAFAQQLNVQWWDQFGPLEELHKELWQTVEGVSVEYTNLNPSDMGQALQLAFRSGQAPDVHTLVGLGLPTVQLVKEDWFSPLVNFSATTPFLQEALFEGITQFDGVTYSFPIFTFRQHETTLWFHKDRMEAAGFDPEVGPRTWDEMREAAKAMTSGNQYGLLLPLQFTGRMENHLMDLADTAGASEGIDWYTGDYTYGNAPYLNALNFLLGFQEDGTLHPASSSLDARQGRLRWLAGEAGMFFDGPWNSGAITRNMPEMLDSIGVASIPIPDINVPAYTYNGPPSGVFWISSQAEDSETVTKLLELFTSEEYYIRLAERMDQPPLNLDAVDRANVHPEYKKVISYFKNVARLNPEPVVKNPNVSEVYARMTPVSPNIGELVQGVFSGGVRDPQAAFADYASKMTAERAQAIEAVQAEGLDVSLDDWIFLNWKAGEDYGPEKY